MSRSWILAGLCAALLTPVLAGCGGSTTAAPLSKSEEQDFKGGPMPASAQAEFAKRMQQSRAQQQAR